MFMLWIKNVLSWQACQMSIEHKIFSWSYVILSYPLLCFSAYLHVCVCLSACPLLSFSLPSLLILPPYLIMKMAISCKVPSFPCILKLSPSSHSICVSRLPLSRFSLFVSPPPTGIHPFFIGVFLGVFLLISYRTLCFLKICMVMCYGKPGSVMLFSFCFQFFPTCSL